MNFKNLKHFTQLVCVITGFFGAETHAFDLSLLKNDKELYSYAYNSNELILAQKNITTQTSEKAFRLLGESISETEKSGQICNLSLVHIFLKKLDSAQIPNNYVSILNLLIVWRDQNLIDDIFFKIIEQSVDLNESLPSATLNKIKPSEIPASDKLLENNKISLADLTSAYSNFSVTNNKNQECSIESWINASRSLSMNYLKTKGVRYLNIAAKNKNIISEKSFGLLELFRLHQIQSWQITVEKYLSILSGSKNSARATPIKPADLNPNALSSRFKNKKTKITFRESLYARFNSMQIGMLSDVLKKMFDRMDSTKVEIIFTSSSGSETLPISPMGQYYLARKLLRKDLTDLSRSTFFGGASISHEDLITAALETGLINANMLDSALKIDDLWNPEIKEWKKIANYGFQVTGTATLFLPPPFNVVGSVALVFIEGLINRKANKTNSEDDLYDVF